MRRKWALVPAWLAVALLVVSPVPVRGSPEQMDLAATAARLDALHVRIAGNREELQASELLNYHRVEGGVATCMRAAGMPYRIRPFLSHYDGFTDADLGFGSGRGSVFDSITDRGRRAVRNELAAARFARAGLHDPPPGPTRPAEVAARNRCTAAYQHRPYSDIDPPQGVYQLSGFRGLLDVVARDPAVIAAMRPYRACMRDRYGHDVTERTDFLFAPRISYRDAPVEGRPPAPAWTRGVKQIEAAFDADVDCRLPAYRIAMTLLAPRLRVWERQHRTEIDAVRAAWKHRVARARDLPHTIP
ncbi:hypothetical protein [Jidongwangia harbinensis]|uniref:hypothetical protein n=1 Tax=Jidongwangia harbinensis TaxID=2878561 RepID=UPI001CD99D22|nr:hypothetical protein [Jidongwangia harbinensis]MCA2219088.1 hypothetical protein [Jidongwangia harbinensis]